MSFVKMSQLPMVQPLDVTNVLNGVPSLDGNALKIVPPKKMGVVVYVMATVCFISLVIFLALVVYRCTYKKEAPPSITCGPAPTINLQTGEITNPQNTLLPNLQSCGVNQTALDSLCYNSRCTYPTCAINATWDKSDGNLVSPRCIKTNSPSCEQQACDAPYCTSSSVVEMLPLQHKFSVSTTDANPQVPQVQCANPSELMVSQLCNNLKEPHQWVFPDCRDISVRVVLDATVQTASTNEITGNFFIIDNNFSNLVFSFGLQNLVTNIGGNNVTVSPGYCLSNLSKNTGPTNRNLENTPCLQFKINLQQYTLSTGIYTLTVFARPNWSSVNTIQSQPTVVTLVASINPSSVTPSMLPVPSRSISFNTLTVSGDVWFTLLLTQLKLIPLYATVSIQIPDLPLTSPLIFLNEVLDSPFLSIVATPNIIALEGDRLLAYQFVILSWPLINVESDETVYYDVTRISATGIGSIQPLYTHLTRPEMMDLVRVGDRWTYNICAYTGSTYDNSSLKSPILVLSLVVAPYSDTEVCHSIHLNVDNTGGPPWMWATSQGCVWDNTNQAATDYYCTIEFEKSKPLFNPSNIVLANPLNLGCGKLMQSVAQINENWDNDQIREAICDSGLKVGGSASINDQTGLMDRLNNIMMYSSLHNVYPDLDLTSIDTPEKQLALYTNTYYNCGPSTIPKTWGVDEKLCLDDYCKNAVSQSGCQASDFYICEPWEFVSKAGNREIYSQHRTTTQ